MQDTHQNPNHRFTIRRHKTSRMDREGKRETGVMMRILNSIPAGNFTVDSNQPAEIHRVNITADNYVIIMCNMYCSVDIELFWWISRHSTCCCYKNRTEEERR